MMRHYTNTNNPIDFPVSDLKHMKGNLLDLAETGKFNVIVQGCNCFNTMGAGIAREIRERFPHIAAIDNETLRGDYNKLGNWTSGVVFGEDDHRFIVINAYTQYNMSKGADVFEYTAFSLILQKLAQQYPKANFGLPYIGCGLAGGDTETIIDMIDMFATQVDKSGGSVTLVEFYHSPTKLPEN